MESRAEPALDFLSTEFDAERALHSDISKLDLPYPNVKPCDNLQAYESLVNGTKRHSEPSEASRVQTEAPPSPKCDAPIHRRPRKEIKSVVNVMEG